MSKVLTCTPGDGDYAWTFGGAAPVARIRPGTVLAVFTEDCLAGRVRSVDDLVSQVCEFPFPAIDPRCTWRPWAPSCSPGPDPTTCLLRSRRRSQ